MLGQTPSAPPRCKAPDDWDPLTSWLSPVVVTWPVRSSKHLCFFDSVITGAFLLTPCLLWLCHDLLFSHDTIVSLTLSPTWHDSVTWVIWLALSSQTPVSLYTCHLTGMTLSHVSHNCYMCDICTETMTMLHVWHMHRDDDNVHHHQLNFVMFAYAQIATSWCQNYHL